MSVHASRSRPAQGSTLPVVPLPPSPDDDSAGPPVPLLASPVTSAVVVSVVELVPAVVEDIEPADVGLVAAVLAVAPVDPSVSPSVPAPASSPEGHPMSAIEPTNSQRVCQSSVVMPPSCPLTVVAFEKSTAHPGRHVRP
jgi:hypothetical protein